MTNNNIIRTWKESFNFLKANSLKLFILASLNNAKRSFLIFLKQFWWVSALVLISIGSISIFYKFFFNISLATTTSVNWLMLSIILALLIFIFYSLLLLFLVVFLVVRASSDKKDNIYLKKNLGKLWGILFIFIIIGLLFSLSTKFFEISCNVNQGLNPFLLKIFILGTILWNIITFTIFFFLDAKAKFLSIFSSILKSIKLVIYYFPSVIFLITVAFGVSYFNNMLFLAGKVFSSNIILYSCFLFIYIVVSIFTSFLSLSLFANYYTIVRHKNYKLFYGDK